MGVIGSSRLGAEVRKKRSRGRVRTDQHLILHMEGELQMLTSAKAENWLSVRQLKIITTGVMSNELAAD